MKYVYAVFLTPDEDKISVVAPDLPGCITFGDDVADALVMAQDAIEMWLWDAENNAAPIPAASDISQLTPPPGGIVNLVVADTDEYRRQHDPKAVKKTLSIPSWLNYEAEKANAPFSQILQEGLKAYLGLDQR